MNVSPNPKENVANPISGSARQKPGFLRKNSMFLSIGGAGGAIVLALAVFFMTRFTVREPFTGPTWTVVKQKLPVTIVERGSLESAENSDIVVRIKAGQRGSQSASNIRWVIDDGKSVKAGQKLIEFEDSGFQDQLRTQRNTVHTAYSAWVGARNETIIQRIDNVTDIETAKVNLLQKDLEFKSYAGIGAAVKMGKLETPEEIRAYLRDQFEKDVRDESANSKGEVTSGYLQDISNYEGIIETARSDKETWLDRARWSARMFKKGLYSQSQADADQSRLESMEINLRKVLGDLDIYRKFTLEQKVQAKWSDVKEAERKLKKTKLQADSKMEKLQAEEVARKAVHDQELDRQNDMERDEKFYKMYSPQDGMVVYYVAENSKFGVGSKQNVVAQGEPVSEAQKLMRIPNLKKMLVNARVHESMISKVRGEESQPTGYCSILRFTFAMGRNDLFGLASYTAALEETRDKFKDREQKITRNGQRAAIRVDSFPGRAFHGRVKSVAQAAAQSDYFSSDIKVYTTMVSIDDTLEEEFLKPGMSAEVTILADETPGPVMVIPIQSIVGNVTMGAKRVCYVLDDKNYPHEREIEIGLSSDRLAEIKSGLNEGERVVLNPRPLIPEKSGMKPGTPQTRRGAEFSEGKEKSGKGKRKGGDDVPEGAGAPPSGKVRQGPSQAREQPPANKE
jgi:multidrug efflux pump subunit AcrA (membrane-fusion protein)